MYEQKDADRIPHRSIRATSTVQFALHLEYKKDIDPDTLMGIGGFGVFVECTSVCI